MDRALVFGTSDGGPIPSRRTRNKLQNNLNVTETLILFKNFTFRTQSGFVAQLVERSPLKRLVAGSSPAGPTMELIEVLDENGQKNGQILDKDIIHQQGLWHREVAVWIFNSKGETLVQRRAASKKMNPNQIGLCAGHVSANEDSITSMIREISEELGICINKESLTFLTTEKKRKIFSKWFN